MSRRNQDANAKRRALEIWQAPEDAGTPLFCIATTFTFHAHFFESECLGRFLGMQSDADESDQVGYLIEREEKLHAARVCVLVDRRHAKDKESLRWDVLPVVVRGGLQHAKLAVLAWTNYVRVIVGSGNLTEPGYRKNLEVFGTIELSRREGGPVEHAVACLDFLDEVVNRSVGDESRRGPKERARGIVAGLRAHVRDWPRNEQPMLVGPAFSGLKQSVLTQLGELWKKVNPAGPPRYLHVLSPFFDVDYTGTDLIDAAGSALAKRRPRGLNFYVSAQVDADGKTRVELPRSLVDAARKVGECNVHRVPLEQDEAEKHPDPQPLHAKILVLDNEDRELMMLGSSNFTRAGLGVRGGGNLEANLVYTARQSDESWRSFSQVWPEIGDDIDINDCKVVWAATPPDVGEEANADVLPLAFREALFDAKLGDGESRLILTFGDGLPDQWQARVPSGPELVSSATWNGETQHAIAWLDVPPFVLEVTWQNSSGGHTASWPVNVVDPATLPPPKELRDLSLDELIEVLGSTRPLHEAVIDALRRRAKRRATAEDVSLDPHKRFNTETLLRRTKRLAVALARLREKLERPALSLDALEWRLNGPVGPLALAKAIAADGRSSVAEMRFCLAELALALARIRPAAAASDAVPVDTVREKIHASIDEIKAKAARLAVSREAGVTVANAIDDYVSATFTFAESQR